MSERTTKARGWMGRLIAVGCCASLLAACGGGGSGGGSQDRAPPLPPPPPTNVAPTAGFELHRNGGHGPLTVSVDGGASQDLDGERLDYDWDFGDAATARGRVASHTYGEPGTYTVTLRVTDERGATAATEQAVTVQLEELVCPAPG